MCTFKVVLACASVLLASTAIAAESAKPRYNFGTKPSAVELAVFVSPLPDGRGMPPGSGTSSAGKTIYDTQCASCHGAKLEGGMGDRLIGGRGSLPGNNPNRAPIKTVESYWPYATTLFDYIKRAMPLTSPGSLRDDEVYAVSAYILSQAKILPEEHVLDSKVMPAIRMPNRDGFIADPRPERFPPPKAASRNGSAP
jgi:S-disulfanyl-L-cysteine oxidoreductase SoxD